MEFLPLNNCAPNEICIALLGILRKYMRDIGKKRPVDALFPRNILGQLMFSQSDIGT